MGISWVMWWDGDGGRADGVSPGDGVLFLFGWLVYSTISS